MLLTVVLEKILESPLDCKETQRVHPKGNQSWIFIGRTDVEAETPILWPPHVKNWLIWKDPDVRKDWRWEEKGSTEDETVGWHHWLDRHEFEQTLGVGDGQGGLVCCSPWGCRVVHYWVSELNWTVLDCLNINSVYPMTIQMVKENMSIWKWNVVIPVDYSSCVNLRGKKKLLKINIFWSFPVGCWMQLHLLWRTNC